MYYYYLSSSDNKEEEDRDIFNEKPTQEEQALAQSNISQMKSGSTKKAGQSTQAIMRTTMGDVTFILFKDKTPKTVYNFVELTI